MKEDFEYFIIFGAAVRPDGRPSAALRRRVEDAFALARDRPGARYIVTGGLGRHPPPEAEVMRDLLIALGAPPDSITMESEGRDTLSSAALCAGILAGRSDVRRVTACSSWYHLPRCRLLLRVLGVKTRKTRMPGGRVPGLGVAGLRACLREAVAIPWDLLVALGLRMVGGRGLSVAGRQVGGEVDRTTAGEVTRSPSSDR